MKVCPTCDQTFNDDSLMYCLLDGAPLVAAEGRPTVVMVPTDKPSTVTFVPPPKKSKTPLIVGLVILVMLIGIVAVAGVLYLLFGGKGDAANANRNGNLINATPLPKASATPRVTPSPSPSATASPAGVPSPTAEGAKPTPKNEESDEITPIAWNTSAGTFKNDVGLTYKFQCPENGTGSVIWGSDIYTGDSSICTAAVHAGVITLERGGVVTLEFRPGRAIYGSTIRNGITSNTFGEYSRSFVVR